MTKIYAKTDTSSAVCGYLTEGKEYETYPVGEDGFDGTPDGFHVLDDEDYEIYCRWEHCAHLNGDSWTRVEVKDELK